MIHLDVLIIINVTWWRSDHDSGSHLKYLNVAAKIKQCETWTGAEHWEHWENPDIIKIRTQIKMLHIFCQNEKYSPLTDQSFRPNHMAFAQVLPHEDHVITGGCTWGAGWPLTPSSEWPGINIYNHVWSCNHCTPEEKPMRCSWKLWE